MKKLKKALLTLVCLLTIGGSAITANAAADPEGTMQGIPGVSWAVENGDVAPGYENSYEASKCFTTNKGKVDFGSTDLEEYDIIYTQYKDVIPTKDRLTTGQHLYKEEVEGVVRVKYWELRHVYSQCIHWGQTEVLNYNHPKCGAYYNQHTQGWIGYCADCGEMIDWMFYYMTADTPATFDHIQMGYFYYYKCPLCDNLEQGRLTSHNCDKISWNRYYVLYVKNGGKGTMLTSTHMYNNETEYNGQPIERQTKLNTNQFTKEGYTFLGWNTKADGSGTWYSDGQEILNLGGATTDGEFVRLYAQWGECSSTVKVIADSSNTTYDDGAKYNGSSTYTISNVPYLGTVNIDKSLISGLSGLQVQFDANGGTITGMSGTGLNNISGTTGYINVTANDIDEWVLNFVSTGSTLDIADNGDTAVLTNNVDYNGYTHTLTITYDMDTFSLPTASKDGAMFNGWELTTGTISLGSKLGNGATITPSDNMATNKVIIFKATYADLSMTAVENYEANNGKGAADLDWEWSSATSAYTTYKIYRDGAWLNTMGAEPLTGNVINSTSNGTYTITQSGLYSFEIAGNKGGNYGSYTGGSGGKVTANVWLSEGDVLTYASADSSYAGGTGTSASGGSAATLYVTRKGTSTKTLLAVAGGGGAATAEANGGSVATTADTTLGTTHTGGSGVFGGGGGSNGGTSGTEYVYEATTKANPDMADVMFMSSATKNYPNYNVIIRGDAGEGGGNNKTGYSTVYTGFISYPESGWLYPPLKVGALNKSWSVYARNSIPEDTEYHWGDDIIYTASVGTPVKYDCYQSDGGFERTYTTTLSTNGNTNLVLGSHISTWNANHSYYMKYKVTNADTGAVIFNDTVASGRATTSSEPAIDDNGYEYYIWSLELSSAIDVNVSGANRVSIEIAVFMEGGGVHSKTYLTDAYFYGKTITNSVARPTTAGTNYINTSEVTSQTYGSNTGSGYVKITPVFLGFDDATYLDGTAANDLAAPYKPTGGLALIDKSTNVATATIHKPKDNGTSYGFSVEAYVKTSLADSANAVPPSLTLTTNVKSYRYELYEGSALTKTETKDLTLISEAKGSKAAVTSDDDITYNVTQKSVAQTLKVYAIDFAGNVSSPLEIPIPAISEAAAPPPAYTLYPIYTRQLTIDDSVENVYRSGTNNQFAWSGSTSLPLYYVRADGEAPFAISGNAYTSAETNYNYFKIHELSYSGYTKTGSSAPGASDNLMRYTILADGLGTSFVQTDYDTKSVNKELYSAIGLPEYKRNDSSTEKGLDTVMSYTVAAEYNGTPIFIYPTANAYHSSLKETVNSTDTSDRLNGLVIMPDAIGPDINDTNIKDAINKYKEDGDNIPDKITIPVSDALSGVRDIEVTVKNLDTGDTVTFTPTPGSNTVTLDTTGNYEHLFKGEFTIIITTTDNVGNETVEEYDFISFTTEASIVYVDMEKASSSDTKYFATIDNGELHITVTGFVDKVAITAPSCITFDDTGDNTVIVSFDKNIPGDIKPTNGPVYEYEIVLPFQVTNKLGSDQTLTFEIDTTKDTLTKTTEVTALYKKDALSIEENGIISTSTNAGIANVYRVPTTYSGLLSGMVGGSSGNSYFVKTDTNFIAKHVVTSTLPTREDATFDLLYMTVKNLTDNTGDVSYKNTTSLEKFILDNAPAYTYRYFKYNNALGNTITVSSTGKDIIKAQATENALNIANGQTIKATNYIQSLNSDLTWSAPASLHGDVIRIIPRATLAYEQGSKISGIDTGNVTAEALYIIPDAVGPVTSGDDGLDGKIFTSGGKETVPLTFTDNESGFHHAVITVTNTSNGVTQTDTTSSPSYSLVVDPSTSLWLGIIDVTITTYDNVGNATTKTYQIFTLYVDCSIANTHEPYTNVFYSGNRGYLFIESIGYADSLTVEFPDDVHPSYWVYQDGDTIGKYEYEKDASGNYVLDDDGDMIPIKNYSGTDSEGNPTLPQTFVIPLEEGSGYDHNSARRIEVVEFVIEDRDDLESIYTVKVTAHKSGASISDTAFLVIQGYSSDLWRTRLR